MSTLLLAASAACIWLAGSRWGQLSEQDIWIKRIQEHWERMPRAQDLETGRSIPVTLISE